MRHGALIQSRRQPVVFARQKQQAEENGRKKLTADVAHPPLPPPRLWAAVLWCEIPAHKADGQTASSNGGRE